MLHTNNSYVRDFRTAIEMNGQESFRVVIHENNKPRQIHSGRYNAPTVNEVAVLMVGQECEKRDIVLHSKDNRLQRISEIHRSYDPLQYPLLFPNGEDGYGIYVSQYYPETGAPNFNKKVSAMNFYSYRMMIRSCEMNLLHLFRQLTNQYWTDMFAKIVTERLNFIRHNQKKS